MSDNVVEEKTDVGSEKADEKPVDKHPETVSWTQYVGIKEKLGKENTDLKGQVTTLNEQLKKTSNPEELTKIKEELESTRTKLQTTSDELKTTTEKTLTEKKAALVKKGIPEDKVKDLSVKELDNVALAVGSFKPAPDLGGGGGSSARIHSSPMESARQAYS